MQKKAIEIAKTSLKRCYKEEGIVAGKTHFQYYWARDSFYASWGALELNDIKIVKKNLETFINYQKENGQLPVRIGGKKIHQILAFTGIYTKTKKATYTQDKGFNPILDSNLLFIITFERYLIKTNDLIFAKANISSLHKAMDFLEKFEKEGLLYEGKYTTWQDSIKKKGYTMYTNTLFYKATESLNNILNLLNIDNNFKEKKEIIKQKINENFYDKKLGYYIDFYNEKQRCEIFSSDGNFFAIYFGLTDKDKTNSILKNAEKLYVSKNTPSYTNSPKYDKCEVYLPFYLVNMHGYHNMDICWPWIGCLHAINLYKNNEKTKAKEIYKKIEILIEKDKDVYEIYEKTGKPVKRLFYTSEKEFAWGASFFILMHNTLNNGKRNN